MTDLCLQLDPTGQLIAAEVSTATACPGYLVVPATETGWPAPLTYAQADEIIGAVSLLFASAFILRALLKLIQNR